MLDEFGAIARHQHETGEAGDGFATAVADGRWVGHLCEVPYEGERVPVLAVRTFIDGEPGDVEARRAA